MGQSGPASLKITFLVDECLSPDIAAYAEGVYHFQATHVLYRKLAGKEDRDLMPYIIRNDYAFVTCNGKDFLDLYAQEEIHPGLIIILPGDLKANEQVEWFDVVLNRITREKDIINKVITIDRDKKIKIFDWFKDNAGTPPPPGL
jgi:predicted nuclease of predicted toxin-antitoxin system